MIRFDTSTMPMRQTDDWTCSATSLAWLLSSIGRPTTEDEAVSLLGPERINAELGLLLGSGQGLVDLLRELGFDARRDWPSWAYTLEMAGQKPLMIGGAAWNHWVAVSGRDGDTLEIMNPAPGFRDVWYSLDHARWQTLGQFAGVWVEGTIVAGSEIDQVAALQTALADLVDRVLAPLGKARLSVAQRKAILAEARDIRIQFLGPR